MRKLILLSLLLCAMSAVKGQSYSELVEKAMDYTLKDSLAQAEELYKEALKLDPKNARNALLFSNLGTVQKRMGRLDDAIESYTMALNITPYATAILLNRASIYMEKGFREKAYLDYCNVIDLLPNDKEARLMRAYIYMYRRQYKEARIDYNVVVGEDAQNMTARLGLVMLDQKEGRFQSAIESLNLLINENPREAMLLKMRANIELEQKYPELALMDLEEAARVDTKDADIWVMIGDIQLELKNKGKAKEAYEKAIALGIPRLNLAEQLKNCR
ncbi:tetratricopeptide repeat protein [uncultured Bacteroides sp.]|uniref:tetratricopeptide repeat protein n=1 Tax=uncultured Bacteroides sp. TaxID=162156 RepID=UPI002631BAD9|nr:tetratricopeptide repeat protein [uncultured Bacteroides sp.]